MNFLKEILGEELFQQVTGKLNAYNGDEANKEKQVKLANLATGDYVGKGKYEAIVEQLTGKNTELDTANGLIEQLKTATKEDEGLQGKIAEYETKTAELKNELVETKLKSAIKVALLSEKAADIDYLTFKLNENLKEKGTTLELDENDNIKNWNDQLTSLKTQFPNQFESSSSKKFEEHKLEKRDDERGLTKAEILKKPYVERVKLYQENPEAFNEIMKE